MVLAALLCAIGIVIPMFSPIQIRLEPASFTLASHVAVMVAMFISPAVAVVVALGTSLGFFLGGFPIVIVMRAVTHVVFAFLGALWLNKHPDTLYNAGKAALFGFVIALIHAACEVLVVIPFYMGNHGDLSEAYYSKGFFISVVLLVGVGSVIHSMVDFYISLLVWKPLNKTARLRPIPARQE